MCVGMWKNSGVGVSFFSEVLDCPQGGVMRVHLKFTRPRIYKKNRN